MKCFKNICKKKKKTEYPFTLDLSENFKNWNPSEQECFKLFNLERASKNIQLFTPVQRLYEVARRRALQLANNGVLDNHRGAKPYHKILQREGFKSTIENLGFGYPTAAKVMNAWMNSPGHRKAIMMRHRKYAAVAVVKKGKFYFWVAWYAR